MFANDIDATGRGDNPSRRASVDFGKLQGSIRGEFLQISHRKTFVTLSKLNDRNKIFWRHLLVITPMAVSNFAKIKMKNFYLGK
jgi:hypothetical protein